MTTLTLAGPALVTGLVPFRSQLPVAITGLAGLSDGCCSPAAGTATPCPSR
jgi:hypothetical protein